MLPVAGVLFDIDGTLIDSNDAHAHAWDDVFREEGLTVSFAAIRASIGMGGDHLLPHLTGIEKEDPRGARMEKRRGELFRDKYLPTLRAFPQARELLETLNAKAYRLVVATSASSKDLHALLKQTHLEGLFDEKTNSGEVEHSKPDPDIIEAALSKSGLDARRAVMIGDTPYDIEAAARADVRTIAVMSGGWSSEALEKAGAWKVFRDPSELHEELVSGRLLI